LLKDFSHTHTHTHTQKHTHTHTHTHAHTNAAVLQNKLVGVRYRFAIPASTLIVLLVDLVHHFIDATCITLLLFNSVVLLLTDSLLTAAVTASGSACVFLL
jgi:hypothetical protein